MRGARAKKLNTSLLLLAKAMRAASATAAGLVRRGGLAARPAAAGAPHAASAACAGRARLPPLPTASVHSFSTTPVARLAQGPPTESRGPVDGGAADFLPPPRRGVLARLFRRGERKGDKSTSPFLSPDRQLERGIPEDLQLPTPAEPIKRFFAAVFDAGLALTGGVVAGYAASYGTGIPEAVGAVGQGTALVLWTLRDGLGDHGNRSLGKALFKLELANWDGTLPQPSACLARNVYFALVPLTAFHPLVTMSLEVVLFFDAASFFVTKDARRVGDYIFGTRVVQERPGRALRALDMHEAVEAGEIRAELEALAPGVLDKLRDGDAGKAWYEDVQKGLRREAAAAAKARQQAAAAAATSMGGRPLASAAGATAAVPGEPAGPSVTGGLGGLFSEVKGVKDESQYVSQRPVRR